MVPLILGNAHILRSPIWRNELLGLAMAVGSRYYRGLNNEPRGLGFRGMLRSFLKYPAPDRNQGIKDLHSPTFHFIVHFLFRLVHH